MDFKRRRNHGSSIGFTTTEMSATQLMGSTTNLNSMGDTSFNHAGS